MKSPKEASQWLTDQLLAASMVMSDKAQETLLERTDFNSERLEKEFYKLCLLNPRPIITTEIVEQLVPTSYSERYFDLIKAAILKDKPQTVALFARIKQQEGAEYKLLKYLFRFWEQAYNIFACWEKGMRDHGEIAASLNLPKFVVKRTFRLLELYNLKKIRLMLTHIYNLDKQVRNYRTDPLVLLENYFLNLGG